MPNQTFDRLALGTGEHPRSRRRDVGTQFLFYDGAFGASAGRRMG